MMPGCQKGTKSLNGIRTHTDTTSEHTSASQDRRCAKLTGHSDDMLTWPLSCHSDAQLVTPIGHLSIIVTSELYAHVATMMSLCCSRGHSHSDVYSQPRYLEPVWVVENVDKLFKLAMRLAAEALGGDGLKRMALRRRRRESARQASAVPAFARKRRDFMLQLRQLPPRSTASQVYVGVEASRESSRRVYPTCLGKI